MLNQRSLATVRASVFNGHTELRAPLYSGYGFSSITSSVRALLHVGPNRNLLPCDCFPNGGIGVERVMMFLVDAMGWDAVEALDHPLLKLFESEGVVSKLTCQFPSATSAHIPTLATGVPPSLHGVPEWWMWLPQIRQIISPLTFTARGSESIRGQLLELGVEPEDVFLRYPVYTFLRRCGIGVASINPEAIRYGPTEGFLRHGTIPHYYRDLLDFPEAFDFAIHHPSAPVQLATSYIPDLDRAGHTYGPHSETWHGVRTAIFDTLQKVIGRNRDGKTLFLVFADHGQTRVDPRDPKLAVDLPHTFPELSELLIKDCNGNTVPMTGGMRAAFLHVEPERLCCAENLIRNRVGDRVLVYKTEELLSRHHLFGPGDCHQLRQRLGNLTLLPIDGTVVTWPDHERKRMNYRGDHGGLSQQEMEIPLLSLM